MPEGDTIFRTATALRDRIGGKVCTSAEPPVFGRLQGKRLVAVEPVGKHLFLRFDSGVSLHSHMRMTGAWHLYSSGQSWRKPRRAAKAVLHFDDTVAVLFSAPIAELVGDDSRVGHLGPDILGEPFELEEIVARATQSGETALGPLLLDQQICAGIGNIYKCESLWELRLNPWKPVGDVPEESVRRLYRTARRLMRESALGASFRRRNAAHGRGGAPCPRCHHLIEVRPQGEPARLTYWCPHCQGDASSAG